MSFWLNWPFCPWYLTKFITFCHYFIRFLLFYLSPPIFVSLNYVIIAINVFQKRDFRSTILLCLISFNLEKPPKPHPPLCYQLNPNSAPTTSASLDHNHHYTKVPILHPPQPHHITKHVIGSWTWWWKRGDRAVYWGDERWRVGLDRFFFL